MLFNAYLFGFVIPSLNGPTAHSSSDALMPSIAMAVEFCFACFLVRVCLCFPTIQEMQVEEPYAMKHIQVFMQDGIAQ